MGASEVVIRDVVSSGRQYGFGQVPMRFDDVKANLEYIFGPPVVPLVAADPPIAAKLGNHSAAERSGVWRFFAITGVLIASGAAAALGVLTLPTKSAIVLLNSSAARHQDKVASAPIAPMSAPARTPAVLGPAKPAPNKSEKRLHTDNTGEAPYAKRMDRPSLGRESRVREVPRAAVKDIENVSRALCSRDTAAQSIACMDDRLQRAHRNLLVAYGAASDDGVPRPELMSINRRWKKARSRVQDDPVEALHIYNLLAAELRDAMRD